MNKALLQQALDALVYHTQQTRPIHKTDLAIEALRTELSKPEPEPVAWMMASAMDDFKRGYIVEVSRCKEELDDVPLFTKEPL